MVELVIPPPAAEDAGRLRQLLPEPRPVVIRELLESLNLGASVPVERPYTVVNFVASVDGRSDFQGRSGALSDPSDREMFHGLRERVDALLVGTGTLRTERYGRLVRDPERRARRAASGLSPEPLACIITRSGDVPLDIPLFEEPAARVVVFTPSELDASALAADVDVVALDPGELTLTTMMRRLRSSYDVRTLLCEGGPILFGALLQEDLVDELFLSLAPKLTGGGSSPGITSGPPLAELRPLSLMWVLERDSALYLRYDLR
jgi:riboflavin-specific deaminase-like protein